MNKSLLLCLAQNNNSQIIPSFQGYPIYKFWALKPMNIVKTAIHCFTCTATWPVYIAYDAEYNIPDTFGTASQ